MESQQIENKTDVDQKLDRLHKHLQMTFIAIGIVSFSLGIAVNYLILKKNLAK